MVKTKPRLAHWQPFKAKQAWPCSACGETIPKDRIYNRYVYSVRGKLKTDRVHKHCVALYEERKA